jgi:hypothetical protein
MRRSKMKSQLFQAILALIIIALAISACGPSPEEQTATAAALTAAAATNTPFPTLTPTPSSLAEACLNDLASYSGLDSNALQESIIQDIFQTFPEFDLFGQPEEFFAEFFSVFSPAWSPNERQIAFSAGVGSAEMFINYGIFILEEGSSEINRLVPDRAAVETLLRSRAEEYGWTEERTSEILEIMGLAPWAINPVWSPDGQKIVFLFGFGDSLGDIWVINSDGSGLVSLGSGEVQHNSSYSWSPDGQQILFNSVDYDYYAVNIDGNNLTSTTRDPSVYVPDRFQCPAGP